MTVTSRNRLADHGLLAHAGLPVREGGYALVAPGVTMNGLLGIVAQVESGGDPHAVGPENYTGERARGVMQTMPSTMRDPGFGVRPAADPNDPAEQARVGRDYLGAMLSRYRGDVDAALAAYNWGPGNADRWVSQGKPMDALPAETRDYITKIRGRMQMAQADSETATDAPPARSAYFDQFLASGASRPPTSGGGYRPVTDPDTLRRLESGEGVPGGGVPPGYRKVTDPATLNRLNSNDGRGSFTREQLIGEAQRRGLPPPEGRTWSDMLLEGEGAQPQEPARSPYFDDYMQRSSGTAERLTPEEMIARKYGPAAQDGAAQTVMGVFQKHGQSISPEQAANIAKAAQDLAGNAFAAGAGDGWFFGFGDNILAALRGYTSEDRTYEGELRRIRIAQDLLEAFNPNATMAGEISGGVASGLATGGLGSAAGVGAGVTTAGKIGRVALGGAGAGGLYGAGSSDGENVAEEVGKGALFGAGGGVVGREVGIALGKVLRRLVGSPQFFDGNRLTDAGRKALAARGLDPALVSDDFAQRFASRVKEAGGASDEVVNMAIAEEFGIPLTRGQATGDVMQIAYEEASRNAARGNAALNTVRSIDNEARRRTGQAVDDIASGFGGADASALGAAERVTEGVKRAASGARQAARSSYAELDAASGGFSGRLVRDLDAALSSRLKEAVPPDAVNANGALAALRRTLGKASAEGQSFTAGELERVRQMLGRYRTAAFKGANAADQMAMQEIVGAFDGWLDDVFTSGLTTADPATLALAQKSRGLWKAYLDNFTARSGDDASKLMAKMAEIDVTPAEAARWIWGTSNIGAKGVSVRLAQKLRTALPPEDWNAVRAGAWRMVAEAPPGKEFGPQAIANNIEAFTKGDGAAMARVLFSAEEIAQMQRFSRAMRLLVPPKAATQPSKTSYGVARLVSDTWDNFGAMMGFATGGLEGGLGAKLGGMAMRGARDGMAARSIPARGPASVINRAPETLGGAAAGGAAASAGNGF